jgi:hypothetical protein
MMEMKEGESIPPATGYVPTVMDGPRPSISIDKFDRKNSDRRGHLYCQKGNERRSKYPPRGGFDQNSSSRAKSRRN